MIRLENLKVTDIKIDVHKSTILFMMLWFPFIKPSLFDSLSNLAVIDTFYNILRVVASLTIILVYIIYCDEWRSSIIDVLMLASLYFVAITIISRGNLPSLAIHLLEYLELCLLVHIAYKFHTFLYCVHGLLLVLLLNLLINAYTIITFSSYGGMYNNIFKNVYYLGHDNTHISFVLPYLALSLFYDRIIIGHIRLITVFFHSLFVLGIIITWSGTSLISVLFFYCLCCLLRNKKISELLNAGIIVSSTVFAWVFFILQRNYYALISFLGALTGKNLRSVRQFIWTLYEKAILKGNIIFGQGYMSETERVMNVGIIHAHDMYLDIVYEGGVVGLLFAALIVYIALSSTNRIRNGAISYLVAAVCAFLVEYQIETLNKSYFVIALIFVFYGSLFIKNEMDIEAE